MNLKRYFANYFKIIPSFAFIHVSSILKKSYQYIFLKLFLVSFFEDAIRHTEITVNLAMQRVREEKHRLYESIGVEDSSEGEAAAALEILKRVCW